MKYSYRQNNQDEKNTRISRYKSTNQTRTKSFALALATVGLLIIGLVVWLLASCGQKITFKEYADKDGFEKFAQGQLKSLNGRNAFGEDKLATYYGNPVSVATKVPVISHNGSNKRISTFVEDEKNDLNANSSDSSKIALIIGYESYETPYPVVSFLLQSIVHTMDKDGSTSKKVKVRSLHLSTNDKTKGAQIGRVAIFTDDYKPIYIKKASEFLKKTYSNKLNSDYLARLSAMDHNFIMTKDGFKFFFDSGTVLPHKEGAIFFNIPYSEFQSILKKDIGKRVIDPDKPMVALTYDDGPHRKLTPRLLELFKKHNSVATLFELGTNIDRLKTSSKLLKEALNMGFEIGTHTYTHPNLFKLSPKQLKEQVDKSEKAFKAAIGVRPTLLRPPYGNGNDKIAAAFNLPSVNWSIDTLDWKKKNKADGAIFAQLKNEKTLNGKIVLLHSIHASTIKASEELVPWLIKNGYQLVTVTEMFNYRYNIHPQSGKHYTPNHLHQLERKHSN